MTSRMYLLLTVITCGLILVSCKDETLSPELAIQMRVGSSNLSEGDVYSINGTMIQIDAANFYLGNVKFTGTKNFEQDDYYLVGTDNNDFTLGDIEAGTYDFEFAIGVDEESNSQTSDDFTSRPAGDPLSLQTPAMHWNWDTGYKFLRVDGMVDTDGDDVPDTAVQYHLGNIEFYAPLLAPVVIDEENKAITLRFDLEGLFKDVDLANGESTHVGDNKPLADQLLANYTEAFTIQN